MHELHFSLRNSDVSGIVIHHLHTYHKGNLQNGYRSQVLSLIKSMQDDTPLISDGSDYTVNELYRVIFFFKRVKMGIKATRSFSEIAP